MNALVPIVLFGWIPAVFIIFMMMRAGRAVIVSFLFGWLFLPVAGFKIAGFPAYDKTSATCAVVLLATLIFDFDRWRRSRPHWMDLPMAVWCLVHLPTSVANGLGAYDGISASVGNVIVWGFPYLIGRVYFSDVKAWRELVIGVFIAGLVYVPFCLFEIKMSPQLNRSIYGFSLYSWGSYQRLGGWRPAVFMGSGLMLAMWMTTASLVAIWIWQNRVVSMIAGVPVKWLVCLLVGTTVLCKSTGALGLLAVGVLVLYATRRLRQPAVVLCLAALSVAYMATRASGLWSGEHLIDAARYVSEERAGSLEFRIKNENLLAVHAVRSPLLGWGRWGRNRPSTLDEEGNTADTTTDGFWIIALGINGIIGLAAVTAVQLLPPLLLLRHWPATMWGRSAMAAGPEAAAVLLILYCIDNLFNAMINPIFMLMAGGLVSFSLYLKAIRAHVPSCSSVASPHRSSPMAEPGIH